MAYPNEPSGAVVKRETYGTALTGFKLYEGKMEAEGGADKPQR